MSPTHLPSAAAGPIVLDARLRTIIDAIPAQVWSAHPDGTAEFQNRRWLEYTGLSAEQASGRGWIVAFHEEDRRRLLEYWQAKVASGESGEIEARIRRFDGQYRWFLLRWDPVRDTSGAVVRWYGTNTDIDDRRRAEEAARTNEQHFRLIVDSIPGQVAILGGAGDIELVNERILSYFGRSLEELQQWTISDSVHPDDLAGMTAAWRRSMSTGEPLETEHRLRRADGVYRWFQLRALPWRDRANQIVRWYCLVTDVDDRKTAEDALRRSETFLLEVQRLSHTGGWRYEVATNLVESSPEIQRAYAVGPDEDISSPAFWFGRIHPEDRPSVQGTFERCVREMTDYRSDYRIVLPDGSIRYQHALGRPIVNESGELVEFIGASMDITEHWLAKTELERASEALRTMQARLSRAAQIATVGELAASIAHEVNQPLAAVVANGHACLRWLSATPPNVDKAAEAAERIVKDGKDAGEVVRRVRSLFKRAAVENVPVDLNEVIREVLRLLEADIARKGVAMETGLEPGLPLVLGDRVQLQQLLLNLLLNALEAVEPIVDRPKELSVRSRRDGDAEAVIEVRDSGVGLDDPDRAFEPFFTTKATGMGMGLAICQSIAAAHDGTLRAARNGGAGTTFSFRLPLQPGAGAP